jgi:hypothetical protein
MEKRIFSQDKTGVAIPNLLSGPGRPIDEIPNERYDGRYRWGVHGGPMSLPGHGGKILFPAQNATG